MVRTALQVFYSDLLQTVSSLPVYGEISGSGGGKLDYNLNKVFFSPTQFPPCYLRRRNEGKTKQNKTKLPFLGLNWREWVQGFEIRLLESSLYIYLYSHMLKR